MRIAHFVLGRCNPDSANGVDKTIYYLSKAQAALGHNVAVFSLTHKPVIPIKGVIVKAYSPCKLPIKLPNSYFVRDLFEVRSPFNLPTKLIKNMLEWKADITHFHFVYIPQNIILARYLRKRKIPYVVSIHGGLSPRAMGRRWYLKIPFKVLFERRYLNRAALIHAVSEIDLKGIEEYGVKNSIVRAPNGIEMECLPKKVNTTLLTQRFPQVADKKVFMFLGRLDPLHKGLDLLLQGFCLANLSKAVLVFVGPDWRENRAGLETLAYQLKINSQVIFAGPAYGQDKFDLLAGADVFVHTSRWEAGVPFSVLEALAIGKPCLVSTEASPGSIIQQHQAGLVVNHHKKDIADGLHYFSSLSQLKLLEMGANACCLASSEFNWRNIAIILVEAYKHALQR